MREEYTMSKIDKDDLVNLGLGVAAIGVVALGALVGKKKTSSTSKNFASKRATSKTSTLTNTSSNANDWKKKQEAVMAKAIKDKNAIFLAATPTDFYYEYVFDCFKCHKRIVLHTGAGRYGYLGDFQCPYCKKEYFAKDDEGRGSCFIYNMDNMPSSYLSSKEPDLTLVNCL